MNSEGTVLEHAIADGGVAFTTYRRTQNDVIFTQEAVLITAHGMTLALRIVSLSSCFRDELREILC